MKIVVKKAKVLGLTVDNYNIATNTENNLKLSQLIEKLQAAQRVAGDVELEMIIEADPMSTTQIGDACADTLTDISDVYDWRGEKFVTLTFDFIGS